MKILRIAFLVFLFVLITGSTSHKFYVSITKVEFVKEKETLQIITKIFIEDLEQALQERYDSSISLASIKETESDVAYLKKYILQKIKIKVNGTPVSIQYIGKEYDIDIVNVYLEIENIKELKSIEIENKILMDMFSEQQNIIHLKTPNNRRSLVLDFDNPKGVLNF